MPSPTMYATRAQLYARGIRAELLVAPSRTVEAVDATGDTLTMPGHGLATDDVVEFALGYQATAPGGLAVGTVYYAKPIADSDDLIQLAASKGGAAIDITSTGSGILTLRKQLGAIIDDVLLAVSGDVDEALVNYGSPLTTWPPSVTNVVCALAAEELAIVQGLLRPDYDKSADRLIGRAEWARKQLARWRDGGEPLRGFPAVVDQTPDVLEDATIVIDGPGVPNWIESDDDSGLAVIP